jgi:hypothetical protein
MKKSEGPVFVPALLRILQESAYTTADLLDVFLSGYGESYRKARRLAYGTGKPTKRGKDWGDAYREAQRFYNLLNYLKRQGLIGKEKAGGERHARWSITRAGQKKLKNERYHAEKDRTLRVVIFDVPEWEKNKREWLREALRSMGFSLLQDSVWIGSQKIPERFLLDLKEKELVSCVHIFSVYREGSIAVP